MSEVMPGVADAPKGNWVDRFAPAAAKPYLQLSRMDRPIGTWLLLLPGWWAIAFALPPTDSGFGWLVVLFAIGALVMRGAGCTFNDITDREFDAQVARTRGRPLPSGRATPRQAWIWLIAQSLVGLVVLLQLNALAIALGVASLGLIALYPYAKRFTWWPQAFLGLAFNWGAILGWAAAAGTVPLAAISLYAAGIAWTLGYDTIYALQDKEDDALAGVKSTARLFGRATKAWLVPFYLLTALGIAAAAYLAGAGWPFWPFFALACAHLVWQIRALRIDDPADCLSKFRSNRDFGLLVLAGALVGSVA
ncbi:4-hydroxybenzoate octaprenyltransferase [Desertibaculum subflavum]|uniref:4-hydroxybenzoate octaprenyltransferase n=1 Tax=Desertibaculum subflavum TaxID=2268458 RepID=UPI000E6714DF